MALTTFQQLKDGLADWIATTTTSPRWSDTTRGIMVNRAIGYITARYDLRFNEAVDFISMVAGTPSYPLSTGFSRPFFAQYLDPVTSQARRLDNMTKDQFNLTFPDPTQTALPTAYSVYGSQLFIGKTPSTAFTLSFYYYNIPPELINPADSNSMTLGCWEAVFDRALVETADYLMDDDRMDVWLRRWRETEMRLVQEHTRSRSTGLIPQSIEPH